MGKLMTGSMTLRPGTLWSDWNNLSTSDKKSFLSAWTGWDGDDTFDGSYYVYRDSSNVVDTDAEVKYAGDASDDTAWGVYNNSASYRARGMAGYFDNLVSGSIPPEDFTVTSITFTQRLWKRNSTGGTANGTHQMRIWSTVFLPDGTRNEGSNSNYPSSVSNDSWTMSCNYTFPGGQLPAIGYALVTRSRKVIGTGGQWCCIGNIEVTFNYTYYLPIAGVVLYDNTHDHRVAINSNVTISPVESNITWYQTNSTLASNAGILSTDSNASYVDAVVDNCYQYTTLSSNTSNNLSCVMTDPTMACAWGYQDLSTYSTGTASFIRNIYWVYDGGSGTSGGFGQMSSTQESTLYCIVFDAPTFIGNTQMTPLTHPIYVGTDKVKHAYIGESLVYGFKNLILDSDGHHLTAG